MGAHACHEPLLPAVVAALVELGYDVPAAASGSADLEEVVLRAVDGLRLFAAPAPTGSVRSDLLALVQRWRGCPTREERAVRVLLAAEEWCPRLAEATRAALDRSLTAAVDVVVARAGADRPSLHSVPALVWVLRSVAVDRVRCGAPRTRADLERLVDLLLCG
ncbi:hypothetical protein ACI797_27335 [Geodermatophilus sp. SYSU D00691]